jgi:hypothetical protein
MKEKQDHIFSPKPFFSPRAILDWFVKRIASRKPASLIRLGDGEFAWLGYNSIAPWEHTSRSLNIWFARDNFDPEQLESTANRLQDAVRAATVIGIPRASRQRREVYCQYVNKIFATHQLTRQGQFYTDCGVHRFWQMLLGYRELLQNLPFLGVVTSRDIANRLSEVFNIKKVVLYPIPSERKALGNFEDIGSHYPERFEQLCSELTVPFRGAVFLVGAGALGKIYADVIYQRGGIALDIGSILDAWAGVGSRSFLIKDPDIFALDCYQTMWNSTPEEILARYRNLLKQTFFGNPPTDQERTFLENYVIIPSYF